MNPDQVWDVVNAQRRALTDVLPELSEEEWRQPSLCAGWTVRDVVAHLAIRNDGLAGALPALLRARGNVDRMVRDSACRAALAYPTTELVARVRAVVDTRRQPPFVGHREVLIDWLVRPQDIMVPLGRSFSTPPAPAAHAADRIWSMGYPIYARKRFAGYAFAANDIDWSAGGGWWRFGAGSDGGDPAPADRPVRRPRAVVGRRRGGAQDVSPIRTTVACSLEVVQMTAGLGCPRLTDISVNSVRQHDGPSVS